MTKVVIVEPTTSAQTPSAKKAAEEKVPASIEALQNGTQEQAIEAHLSQIKIRKNFNSRHVFDASKIASLAADIAANGLRTPLTVVEVAPEKYELLEGERRYRALQAIKWPHKILCVLQPRKTYAAEKLDNLAENVNREPIRPCDLARECHYLETQEKLSREAIALRTGVSKPHVANLVRCVARLHPKIQEAWFNPSAQAEMPVRMLIEWSQHPHEIQLKKFDDFLAVDDDPEDGDSGDGSGSGNGSKSSDEDDAAAKPPTKSQIKAKLAELSDLQKEEPTERRGAHVKALRWALGEIRQLR